MASLGDVFDWSKKPGFYQAFSLIYGSSKEAAKKLGITPATLSRITRAGITGRGDYRPSDKLALKLRDGLTRIGKTAHGKRTIKAAEKYARVVRDSMTPLQVESLVPKYTKTKVGQEHFLEQVEKYRSNRPVHYEGGQYYNAEMMKNYKSKWKHRHPSKVKEYARRYRQKHREQLRIAEYHRRQRIRNAGRR